MSPNLARYSFILLILVVWEGFVRLGTVSPILVAPPSIVIWHIVKIVSTYTTVPEFYTNAWITVREVVAAYVLVVVMGISIGFAFAANKKIGDAFEPVYIGLARSMGYNKFEIFFKVILPAAAPTMLAGLRLGFGLSIIGVIVGELLVVNAGLGYLIDWAAFQYFTPQLYALIIITLTIGVGGNYLFTGLERRW